jgi:acetylornithine deacetylase/succinyl-diaminopimelate desuccinylase-like protein
MQVVDDYIQELKIEGLEK